MLFELPILIETVKLSANNPHRIKLPVNGGTYKKLMFVFKHTDGATALTNQNVSDALKYFTLEAMRNKETFPILDALDVDDVNFLRKRYGEQHGLNVIAGTLTYTPTTYGTDEYHRTISNLGTLDLQSLTAIIHTTAALGDVATLEVYAFYDENNRQVLGTHRRIGFFRPDVLAGKTGKMDGVVLPEYDSRFGYLAVHMKLPANTAISELSQVRNTTKKDFTDIPIALFQDRDMEMRRRPQAGWVSLDYSLADLPTAFMPAGFKKCQLFPNISTAPGVNTSMKVLYEVVELPAKA